MAKYIVRSIDDIVDANNDAGGLFFSPDTMRFFNSRKMRGVVHVLAEKRVLFFTSEKACFDDYTRVYSVNVFDPETGKIDTTRRHEFDSPRKARRFAAKCAETGVIPSNGLFD